MKVGKYKINTSSRGGHLYPSFSDAHTYTHMNEKYT